MRNLIRKDEADGFVATKTGKRWWKNREMMGKWWS
jgi:hypothetical protein